MNKTPRRYQEDEHISQQIQYNMESWHTTCLNSKQRKSIGLDKHISQGQNVREQIPGSPEFECLLNQDFVFDDGNYDLQYFSQKT